MLVRCVYKPISFITIFYSPLVVTGMDGGLPLFPGEGGVSSPLFTDEVQDEGSSRDEQSYNEFRDLFTDLFEVTSQDTSEPSGSSGVIQDDITFLMTELDKMIDGSVQSSEEVGCAISDPTGETRDHFIEKIHESERLKTFLRNPLENGLPSDIHTFLHGFKIRIIARYPELLKTSAYGKVVDALQKSRQALPSDSYEVSNDPRKIGKISIFNAKNEVVVLPKGIATFSKGRPNGLYVCTHGKLRHGCKICNPNAFCCHGSEKYRCKLCNCKHGVARGKCPECSEPQTGNCVHGKRLYWCQPCGGRAYCGHGIWKVNCKKCKEAIKESSMKSAVTTEESAVTTEQSAVTTDESAVTTEGSGVTTEESAVTTEESVDIPVSSQVDPNSKKRKCPHGREPHRCYECGGAGACIHNTQHDMCSICNRCIHNVHKYRCVHCDGRHVCKHNRNKYNCKECKAAREQAAT